MNVSLRISALFFSALFITTALAQDNPSTPKKAQHVWTNEDVQGLKGGVNVVGQENAQPPKSKSNDPFSKRSADASKSETPAEICDSDRWSAAVATIVGAQGVTLDGHFWRTRIFGDLCSSRVTLQAVSQRITGDYTLDDGTRLHLTSTTSALPKPEEVITATESGTPYILSWKKKPLVLTKVDYVVRVSDEGNTYNISKLYLADAITGHPFLFDATTDKVTDIDGVLDIKVSKRQ